MGARRNVFLYLPYQILSLEGVGHGLYVLWLALHKGFSAPTIAGLLVLGDLVLTLAQVPAGMLADRFGHRTSLLFGSACQFLGILAFWRGDSVVALGAASVLIGLGDALRDGADEALLYNSLAQLRKRHRFGELLGQARQRSVFALVVLLLGGGWLATNYSFDLVWLVEAGLAGAGFLVAFLMQEMPEAQAEIDSSDSVVPPFRLVFPATTLVALASATSFAVEATWNGQAFGLTLVVAATMLAEGLGAGLTGRGLAFSRHLCYLSLTLVPLLYCAPAWVLIVVSVITSFGEGAADPIRAAELQEWASPGARATAASVAYTWDMLAQSLALALCGWLLAF